MIGQWQYQVKPSAIDVVNEIDHTAGPRLHRLISPYSSLPADVRPAVNASGRIRSTAFATPSKIFNQSFNQKVFALCVTGSRNFSVKVLVLL